MHGQDMNILYLIFNKTKTRSVMQKKKKNVYIEKTKIKGKHDFYLFLILFIATVHRYT